MKKVYCLLIMVFCMTYTMMAADIFSMFNKQKKMLHYVVLSGTTVEVVKNDDSPYDYKEITIPDHVVYKGVNYIVTGIGRYAFYNSAKLTKIVLPKTITVIKEGAFADSGLADIDLPTSVKTIGASAFSKCKLLSNVSLSSSVEFIGEMAFAFCEKLDNIQIPASVKAIKGGCFYGCSNLKKITIPDSITSLDTYVRVDKVNGRNYESFCLGFLGGCTSLKNILIPTSIRKIGELAFAESGLENIVIPNSVQEIEGGCFYKCTNLRKAVLPNIIKSLPSKKILLGDLMTYQGFFEGCVNLDSFIIPPSVASIGESAFKGCTRLTSITIPSLVTRIEEQAFWNCKSLGSIKGLTSSVYCEEYYNPISKQTERKTPFYGTSIDLDDIKSSFSYFALPRIRKELKDWQVKKGFETNKQWQDRVTGNNRQLKIQELIAKHKRIYFSENMKEVPNGRLENYDKDYNACVVSFGKFGKQYVKIPVDEMGNVRKKWGKSEILLKPDVVNDHFKIVEIVLKIGKRTYEGLTKEIEEESDLALELPDFSIDSWGKDDIDDVKSTSVLDNEIDHNIPVTSVANLKTFAIIIGNENYQRVSKVSYALNDAQIFAAYCQKTLGIPTTNIRSYKDATYGTMLSAIDDIKKIAKAYQGDIKVLFYYAGHGFPDESNQSAYLLPVDADGTQLKACYPISQLYQELSSLQAHSVIVFMDACFSGAQRGEGMLVSTRGVALKVKADTPQGNLVVFSAANGDETAYPYKEKGHGLFTYFLLKKLQESKGDVSLGELGDYISTQVAQQSVVINRKSQTPTVVPSVSMGDGWKTMKLNK